MMMRAAVVAALLLADVAVGTGLGDGCPLKLRGGCGFLGIYGSVLDPIALRMKTLKLQRLIRHRGPDGSGIHVIKAKEEGRSHAVAHERLAIVGVMDDPEAKSATKIDQHPHLHTLSGNQPLYSFDGTKALSVNGEIYNYKSLQKLVKSKQPFRTASDCEVIVHLYDEIGDRVAEMLDGDFAFVIMDEKNSEIYAARDPMGVNSMYIGWGGDGSVWFSSEMKCLLSDCVKVEQFPPGNFWSSKTRTFTQYYKPAWISFNSAQTQLDFAVMRDKWVLPPPLFDLKVTPLSVFKWEGGRAHGRAGARDGGLRMDG
jgi:asparagine synthase (glutamine-hydrolysing)